MASLVRSMSSVQGLGLGVAAGQGGDRSHVIAFAIPFDDDIKLVSHEQRAVYDNSLISGISGSSFCSSAAGVFDRV